MNAKQGAYYGICYGIAMNRRRRDRLHCTLADPCQHKTPSDLIRKDKSSSRENTQLYSQMLNSKITFSKMP